VAQALGVSSNHVAVLLHRAKSALRVCMTADADATERVVAPST
jgi:DNA-directed RNA polymerase specialized sigma24 family protein